MRTNKFDKLEILQKEFPIGTVVEWREPQSYVASFYNENDLRIMRSQEVIESVEIIGDNTVKIMTKKIPQTVINGYIFDGEKWCPAYETWDGWIEWEG